MFDLSSQTPVEPNPLAPRVVSSSSSTSSISNIPILVMTICAIRSPFFTPKSISEWLNSSQKIKADITQGETGESFAVFFHPSSNIAKQDLKKIIGHIARLLDKDKPYAKVSSIRLETRGGKSVIRIGWST